MSQTHVGLAGNRVGAADSERRLLEPPHGRTLLLEHGELGGSERTEDAMELLWRVAL